MDALASRGDEGRARLRYVSGSRQGVLIGEFTHGATELIVRLTTYGSERGELKHLSTLRKRNQKRLR